MNTAKTAVGPNRRSWSGIVIPCALLAVIAAAIVVLTAPWRAEYALRHASLDELAADARLRPGDEAVFSTLAVRASEAGQVHLADDAYAHAVGLAPNDEKIWLTWAGFLKAHGQPRRAVGVLTIFLHKCPQSGHAHLELARLWQQTHADVSAYAEAIAAAKLSPHDPAAWRIAGEEALILQRDQDAVDALRRTIALAPQDWQSRLQLGNALFDSGDPNGAIEICRQALLLAPNEATPDLALGTFLLAQAKRPLEIEEARQYLLRALELDPNLSRGFFSLGQSYSREADWKSALRAFEEARRHDPSDPNVHYELSRVYRTLGNQTEATREAELHTALIDYNSQRQNLTQRFRNANDISAGLALARLLTKHRDFSQAIQCYREVIAWSPHSLTARQELLESIKHHPLPLQN